MARTRIIQITVTTPDDYQIEDTRWFFEDILENTRVKMTEFDIKKYEDRIMTQPIQSYKDRFAALYEEMIADANVNSASVSISWVSEKKDGEWVRKPSVLITF